MTHRSTQFQFGPFSERFEKVETLYLDPAFSLLKAHDCMSGDEVRLQLMHLHTLESKETLPLQWEALKACRDSLWLRPQEWLEKHHYGILISWVPPGRFFNEITGTLPDEFYLKWLKEGLQDLGQLHRCGLLHLAQNEKTWILFKSDEEKGEESLGISDVSLLTEVPLGQKMTGPSAIAIAPEILKGQEVDGRADIYSLACLVLRQRSVHQMERYQGLKACLKLHWHGKMVDKVPRRETTLNEVLRKMLQPNPQDRPSNIHEVIKLINPENSKNRERTRSFPEWSKARTRARQNTLILNSLYSLIELGETRLSGEMLEFLNPYLLKKHEAYLRYLQGRLSRSEGKEEEAKEWRRQATVKIYTQPDPKLKTLLCLEEAKASSLQGKRKESLKFLDQAWESIEKYPEPGLRIKVLYERGRAHKELGQDSQALQELRAAFDQISENKKQPGKEEVYGELSELLSAYGLPRQAQPLMDQALEFSEEAPAERARRFLQAAVGSVARLDWNHAEKQFKEAKHAWSVMKDLRGVLWAGAHSVRFPIAKRDWVQVRRGLKALRNRNRDTHYHQTLLDLLEIQLWLGSGETLSPKQEKIFESIKHIAEKAVEGNIFSDLGWPPYQTCLLLELAYQKMGKFAEAGTFHKLEQEQRLELTKLLKQLGYSEEKPIEGVESLISVKSLKVESLLEEKEALPEETKETTAEKSFRAHIANLEGELKHLGMVRDHLIGENRSLNREIVKLNEKLEKLSKGLLPKPSKPRR